MNSVKKIAVLGAGESGVGAAILAHKNGMEVWVSDKGKIKNKYLETLQKEAIPFEEGYHSEDIILNADEVIKSPGITEKTELIQKLRAKNIPVISEIEFAARYTNAKLICITGSNGKTTTTLLTYHIFKNAGLNVGLAGNVGKSFAYQVATENFDYYVIELSSFQLDDMYKFKADISVLLNITPDHLDRYNYNLQDYVNAKFRIVQNQTSQDSFIYCLDDEITKMEVGKRNISAKKFPFSITQTMEEGASLINQEIVLNVNKSQLSMPANRLSLPGKHNIYNSMAAGIAAKVMDIRKDSIRESLADFQNIEHRLEFVATIHGVEFINDSKATNVNSAWYALESMNRPVVWIVGGTDKGNDYNILKDLVKEKVHTIVCLGKDNRKIISAFSTVVPFITEASTAKEAVMKASKASKQGDTVLLSPACASFDLFENYEDRGNQFKAAIREL
ncbi:MAG TPA: UDP-N-acetylmuramoyl-L-alanine--D-glutamate ligase [Bacteroidia bacterium]|nr:UDP-N-acetylmuramoyl-L-alanine--D-glutamate ligase [Bacteroidia bacterium]